MTYSKVPRIAVSLSLLAFFACGEKVDQKPVEAKAEPSGTAQKTEKEQVEVTAGEGWFVNQTEALGIDFKHWDGRSGMRYFIETAGSGAGWFDYDNDGDLDVYLVNAAATPGSPALEPTTNALYENQGDRFVDVTEKAGVGDGGYGTGVCVGDIDGDGFLDLFVGNYGADKLFHNQGDGTFVDISEKAGVASPLWATSAAFGDLDGDGDLDLYVANYTQFNFENHRQCGIGYANILSYCDPDAFHGEPDLLYINQGDGTFKEEARERGIAGGLEEKGYGVTLSDIDDDGDLDIFVANDGTMNRLYINDGKGHFEDHSLLSGLGYNGAGEVEAGMGIDLGDADGDGLFDLMVTNYSKETNTLYMNRGELFFEDATQLAGLAQASYQPVGWGVLFFDFDNDGDQDMAVANGHVLDNVDKIDPGITYAQKNQLFENVGDGKFQEISHKAGLPFQEEKVSRGLAVGDYNNDGRVDVLITNTNDHPDILENRFPGDNKWVGFKLDGGGSNPSAIGAKVRLKRGDQLLAVKEVRSGAGFMSQSDLRLHFGLGKNAEPVTLEVTWPGGQKQQETFAELNRYHTVGRRGER